jgi:DNA-binding transcriptional regulator YiaG
MMTIADIHKASGMSLKQFSDYFNIPYRTLQHWIGGTRECPPYLITLIEFKLRAEGFIN